MYFFKILLRQTKTKDSLLQKLQKCNKVNFLNDVKNCDFSLKTDGPNENYDFLTNNFINIVNNHAPLKKKFIRGNQAPFMTRNLRKDIYTRSRLEINFVKTLLKKIKNYIKNKETNVLPLRGNA